MVDLRIEKLAQTLVDYSVAVREGDRVLINGSVLAEPLLKEIYGKVLQAGGHTKSNFSDQRKGRIVGIKLRSRINKIK